MAGHVERFLAMTGWQELDLGFGDNILPRGTTKGKAEQNSSGPQDSHIQT
jgi:hypothetical protein